MKNTKKLNIKEMEKVNGGLELASLVRGDLADATSIYTNWVLADSSMGSAPSEPPQKHTIGFPI